MFLVLLFKIYGKCCRKEENAAARNCICRWSMHTVSSSVTVVSYIQRRNSCCQTSSPGSITMFSSNEEIPNERADEHSTICLQQCHFSLLISTTDRLTGFVSPQPVTDGDAARCKDWSADDRGHCGTCLHTHCSPVQAVAHVCVWNMYFICRLCRQMPLRSNSFTLKLLMWQTVG